MTKTIRRFLRTTLLGSAALLGVSASAADPDHALHSGRAAVYRNLHAESLERLSSPAEISEVARAAARGAAAPTRLWKVLEHGERVECLSCIPEVEKLLWHQDPRAREISAWWLRRRVFGVFGDGQVYQRVVRTLSDPSQPENLRVYAANALGEFLTFAGVKHLSAAIRTDASPRVRAAAVAGLERINSSGTNGELALAMSDTDETVRIQALHSCIRIHAFAAVDAVAGRLGDPSAVVRRKAVEALGTLRARDAVLGLVALTSPATESDADVRKAAVYALGQLGDPQAAEAVRAAATDPDRHVRDAATIAARKLGIAL